MDLLIMDCILKIKDNPDPECIRGCIQEVFKNELFDPGDTVYNVSSECKLTSYNTTYFFRSPVTCTPLQEQFLKYATAVSREVRCGIAFINAIQTGILVISRTARRFTVVESNKATFPLFEFTDLKKALQEWGIIDAVKKSRRDKKEFTTSVTVDCVEYSVTINTERGGTPPKRTYIYFNKTSDSKLPELLCAYNRNIKQELNNILNMVSLIHDTNPGHFQLEYTNRINQSTMTMISLLNDYNDYYVIKTHPERILLNPVTVSVANLVSNAVSIIKTKYNFNVTFQLRIHKGISSVSVDRNKLLQLILNVISNGLNAGGGSDSSVYVIACKKVESSVLFTHTYTTGHTLIDSPGVYGVFALQLIKTFHGKLISDLPNETVYSIPVAPPVYDSSNSSDSVETVETIDVSGASIYLCMPPTDQRRDQVSGILTEARIPFLVFGNVVELTYYVSMLTPRSKGVHNIIITTATRWTMRQKTNYDFIYLSSPDASVEGDVECVPITKVGILNSIQKCILSYNNGGNDQIPVLPTVITPTDTNKDQSVSFIPANTIVCKSDPGCTSKRVPRVLIVDDHSIHRKTIESILRKMGVTKVDTASDYDTGVSAITKSVRNNKIYTAILIDLYMPLHPPHPPQYPPQHTERNKRFSMNVQGSKKSGSGFLDRLSSTSGPVSADPLSGSGSGSGIRLAGKIQSLPAYTSVTLVGLTNAEYDTPPAGFTCTLSKPVSMQDLQPIIFGGVFGC